MKTTPLPTAATLAAVLAAGLALAACNPAAEQAKATPPDTVEGSATVLAEKAMDRASDATITLAVNAALAKDEELSVLRIDVDTVGGHVVLAGSAPSADARRRATFLARGVPGVKSVDNRLALPPTS